MKRILSKFGAYFSHLIALAEDTSVKALIELNFVDSALNGQMPSTFLVCAFF